MRNELIIILVLCVFISACSMINTDKTSVNMTNSSVQEEDVYFKNEITYDAGKITSEYIPVKASEGKYFFEYTVFRGTKRLAATTEGFEGVSKEKPISITVKNVDIYENYKFYSRILNENNTEVYKSTYYFRPSDYGVECTKNDDCTIDPDYAIRSSCPFEGICVDQRCKSGCPIIYDDPCLQDSHCNCSSYTAEDKQACSCIEGTCYAVAG